MECKKTGAHIYLEQHGMWAVCDAFLLGVDIRTEEPIWLFRIVGTRFKPMRDVRHFTVHDTTMWFLDNPVQTITTAKATYHGYEGVPL